MGIFVVIIVVPLNGQACTDILKAMQNGELGEKGRQQIDCFKELCHKRMPNAVDFFSGQYVPPSANHNHTDHTMVGSLTNHVSCLSVEDGTN